MMILVLFSNEPSATQQRHCPCSLSHTQAADSRLEANSYQKKANVESMTNPAEQLTSTKFRK
jgi:hypothetical protein